MGILFKEKAASGISANEDNSKNTNENALFIKEKLNSGLHLMKSMRYLECRLLLAGF